MQLRHPGLTRRRGVILLVVLAMLTLFAIVGISFVLYSSAQANSARLAKEAESLSLGTAPNGVPNMSPQVCLAMFLGQLIYDTKDDPTGITSALRGSSLARSMYGYNYTVNASNQIVPLDSNNLLLNTVPFNGTGRLHYPDPEAQAQGVTLDAFNRVNYIYHGNNVSDPERVQNGTGRAATATGSNSPFLGGFNAPYTYPDANNFFLAAVSANGTVITPSYHRASIFGALNTNATNNPNWNAPQCFYLTPRPSPVVNPTFPYPTDPNGDVKNLTWAPGGNDSVWVDIGAPVLKADDGSQYKMLVAPLILDLDSRVNLNLAGNILMNGGHVSNQGLGPWEVNLGSVLTADPTEWTNLFNGSGSNPGRYGADKMPWAGGPALMLPQGQPSAFGASGLSQNSPLYHFYAPMDLNAWSETKNQVSTPPMMPGQGAAPATNPFALFQNGFDSGGNAELVPGANLPAHPLLYDVYRTRRPIHGNDDVLFNSAEDLECLLRPTSVAAGAPNGGTGLASRLPLLCPKNFGYGGTNFRWRNLVTTFSNDLGAPGSIPYWYGGQNTYTLQPDPQQPANITFPFIPLGQSIPFPTVPPAMGQNVTTAPTEFSASWQAQSAAWQLGSALAKRVNLNQPLPPYPHMGQGLLPPFSRTPLSPPDTQYDLQNNQKVTQQFVAAQTARQNLANQIYQQLLQLTGYDPADMNYVVQRYLAQLAVNIVDYIDEDDISTPFQFSSAANPQTVGPDSPNPSGANPAGWVFGTEMPRVVLNEAMAQTPDANTANANNNASVQVWVELYNPLVAPQAMTNTQPADTWRVPLSITPKDGNPAYSPFRISITSSGLGANGLMDVAANDPTDSLPALNSNVLGKPAQSAGNPPSPFPQETNDQDFQNPAKTVSGQNQAQAPAGGPQGSPGIDPGNFLLVGPPAGNKNFSDPFQAQKNGPPGVPPTVPIVSTANMAYTTNFVANPPAPDERTTGLTVCLRRLANPYLRVNGTPTGQSYNPFVTVDYMTQVPVYTSGSTNPLTITSRGKKQPFGGLTIATPKTTTLQAGSPVADQQGNGNQASIAINGNAANNTNNVLTTFGYQNSPLPPSNNYSWLVHLDRPPTSPLELLHVSGYQPHQLTQQFVVGDDTTPTNLFRHYAPWFNTNIQGNQSTRLYRLLEFFECGNRTNGVGSLDNIVGRLPGKVNINTIWDPETFFALMDASNGTLGPNLANAQQQLWQNLMASRSPNVALDPTSHLVTGGTIGSNDQPFLPLSVGFTTAAGGSQYPAGLSLQNTLLRLQNAGQPPTQYQPVPSGGSNLLLEDPADTPATHPYIRTMLLNKLYNNITTRSNTFAVFLTVGFFSVTNANATPVTIGPEVGLSTNSNIRHHMFAIVDRTNLAAFSTTSIPRYSDPNNNKLVINPQPDPTNSGQMLPIADLSAIMPTSGTNPNTGVPWQLNAGMQLTVEPGTDNEETVTVSVNPNTSKFTATFQRPHPNLATVDPNPPSPPLPIGIICRGNPGPWLYYDQRMDPLVVPYFNIID